MFTFDPLTQLKTETHSLVYFVRISDIDAPNPTPDSNFNTAGVRYIPRVVQTYPTIR